MYGCYIKRANYVYVYTSAYHLSLQASEVRHLAGLDCLEKLYLKGNPVAKSASYRSTVFSHLPNTAKQVKTLM